MQIDREELLRSLPTRPGVYRMIDAGGEVIYVGKARNLKNRVASYFGKSGASPKTRRLVEQIARVEVTVTRTEDEALLLENNLIKKSRPRYNVLLRDDKSYPYIRLTSDDAFPRLSFYRGSRREPGRYFGPYPSAGAVRGALNQLQRLFRIRQCEDVFFRNRTRPCLQYQIQRCSAPCVGLVGEAEYAADVRHAVMFLEGRNSEVIDELAARMDRAADKLDFELAAWYRDQIASLRRVIEQQTISGEGGDSDVIAARVSNGIGCIVVMIIRGGHVLGDRTFFPRHPPEADAVDLIGAFLPQYYLGRDIPPDIVVSDPPEDIELIREVLEADAGHRVAIHGRVRGERARRVRLAVANADHALAAHHASRASLLQRFAELQDALGLDQLPERLECFDISHTMGEATVASCVVFDRNGPLKSDYRRFNIDDVAPGDDYAAMRQALSRRYLKVKQGEGRLPDVLFIDGGKGQLRQAEEALEELQIDGVTLVGVAKGPGRKAGTEALYLSGRREPLLLAPDAPALQLVLQIRDEAHRFALTGHRGRRAKARNRSPLEDIPGIGAARRRNLLRQFGGLQGLARAGLDDLAKVPGISAELARRIYETLHGTTD